MQENTWIIEVLKDLKDFARRNEMKELERSLAISEEAAVSEVVRLSRLFEYDIDLGRGLPH